jgi:predicted HicB family RNase H-like nuclease
MSIENLMEIDGQRATIAYDPDINMFRGEFTGLNGGADFYADNIEDLKKEGSTSLSVFIETCKRNGIEPFKNFSGKFMIRIDPSLHEKIAAVSAAKGISINKLIEAELELAI